jgi:hypothetical protein
LGLCQFARLRERLAGQEATSCLKRYEDRIGRIFAMRVRQTTDHLDFKISHIRCQSRSFAIYPRHQCRVPPSAWFWQMWDTTGLPLKPLRGPQHHTGALRSHQRTKAENDGRSPCPLRVFGNGLECAVFEKIYQPGTHMIDVAAHCNLCRFTVVRFERLQNRQVGI